MGLLDLTGIDGRLYGGLGFMIRKPATIISAQQSDAWKIVGAALEDRTRGELGSIIERLRGRTDRAALVTISDQPPSHVGFGSKTSLLLSFITAVSSALGIPLSRDELISLSGRGGTSGIGSWGFFVGGFVMDAGRPLSEITTPGPSSSVRPMHPPEMQLQLGFPSRWKVMLLLPEGSRLAGETEQKIFDDAFPIPEEESRRAMSLASDVIVPAIGAEDLLQLRDALLEFNVNGFKSREMAAQSPAVRETYNQLSKCPVMAPGMSSMGPLLYAIVDETDVEFASEFVTSKLNDPLIQMQWVEADNRGSVECLTDIAM